MNWPRTTKPASVFTGNRFQRQIRIEGVVEKISDAESDAYFATRPRGSQIGAWASLQSQTLENRETLENRVREIEKQYQGRDVPRPSALGRLSPDTVYFEFWQERLYRLHDRITYKDKNGAWQIERLYP